MLEFSQKMVVKNIMPAFVLGPVFRIELDDRRVQLLQIGRDYA